MLGLAPFEELLPGQAVHQVVVEVVHNLVVPDRNAEVENRAKVDGIKLADLGRERAHLVKQRRIVAVEPAACPSLTRGKFAYDFGDTAHMTPLTKMHTLGSTFTPPGFHAGGLRYHGMAPLVSHLKELNLIEATAYHQTACFEAGVMFARAEGIVPAPEANHAVKGAIVEALRCKAEGRSEVILFNLCGHGHFDMSAYSAYFAGKLVDQQYDEAELAMALSGLPSVPA